MVPFSFHESLLKSRVMKEHLADALDDGINGFLDNGSMVSIIVRHAGKTQKRLNEPNSKNANPPLNIDDLSNFDFIKK
jgi:hypothetical protein